MTRVQYGRTALIKAVFILSQRKMKARELSQTLNIPMRTIYRILVYIRESGFLIQKGTSYWIDPIGGDPVLSNRDKIVKDAES